MPGRKPKTMPDHKKLLVLWLALVCPGLWGQPETRRRFRHSASRNHIREEGERAQSNCHNSVAAHFQGGGMYGMTLSWVKVYIVLRMKTAGLPGCQAARLPGCLSAACLLPACLPANQQC